MSDEIDALIEKVADPELHTDRCTYTIEQVRAVASAAYAKGALARLGDAQRIVRRELARDVIESAKKRADLDPEVVLFSILQDMREFAGEEEA